MQLRQQMDILAVGVIFRHRIGAAKIDAARHLAIGKEMVAIPIGKGDRGIIDPQTQQRVRHHRAVADPAAIIGAGARLERGAVAADENVGERRAQRVDQLPPSGGDADGDAAQPLPPDVGRARQGSVEIGRRRAGKIDGHVEMIAGREADGPAHARLRHMSLILHGCRERQRFGRGERALVEAAHADRLGRDHGSEQAIDRRIAVDRAGLADQEVRSVPAQRGDRADAAALRQKLRGRVHLKRSHRERQGEGARPVAFVADLPAAKQARRVALGFGEGRAVEDPALPLPTRGGDGEIAILEPLARGDVRPVDGRAIDGEERFDRIAALGGLDRAVLADQASDRAAIGPDQRPIGLFEEAARIAAARGILGQAGDEVIGGWRPVDVFDRDLRKTACRQHADAQIARLRIMKGNGIAAAIARIDGAQRLPGAAIVGAFDAVGRLPLPVEQQRGQALRRAQIEDQGLALLPMPGGLAVAVQHGRIAGPGRRRRRRGRQGLKRQLVDFDMTLAAIAAAHQHDFHARGAAQAFVLRRPPGERHVARADAQFLPVLRRPEVQLLHPPDIVARSVREFELEIVDAAPPPQLEAQDIIFGPVDRQGTRGEGIAGHGGEIIVEPQRLAAVARHARNARDHAIGGGGGPAIGLLKAVGRHRLRGREQESERRQRHPSQPPVKPARCSPRRTCGFFFIVFQTRPVR